MQLQICMGRGRGTRIELRGVRVPLMMSNI
jgi:hypothetical protein